MIYGIGGQLLEETDTVHKGPRVYICNTVCNLSVQAFSVLCKVVEKIENYKLRHFGHGEDARPQV